MANGAFSPPTHAGERHGGHLAAGFMGTYYLHDTLSLYGYGELAYTVATQTTYPSWSFMIENGATTLWEVWQYETGSGMNSYNHPALGAIDGWLYQFVAGIQPRLHEGRILYRLEPLNQLDWATATVGLAIGPARIHWERQDGTVVLQIEVPHGVRGISMRLYTESLRSMQRGFGSIPPLKSSACLRGLSPTRFQVPRSRTIGM